MENASKALIMAGGILIALIIIAVLVRTFSSVSSFQKINLTEEEQAKIIAFNEQYTKYLGQYVYGTEVITLKNKYENDKLVVVKLTEGSEDPTLEDNKYKYSENDRSYSNETRFYKCIGIDYDNSTGRVKSITFDQVKLNSNVGI